MSRRRRSHRAHADSLDLLLGPMCNTFGGIVLMAVVMALLSREVDVSAQAVARSAAASDTTEMLARRIAKAEGDLTSAEVFQATLDKRSEDPLLAQRVKLVSERANLRQELDALQHAPRGSGSPDTNADPGVVANGLHVELASLNAQNVDLENARATLDENLARLHSRQTDLAAQTQTEKDKSVKKLRLPKERAKTKEPFFVILRYGRVYPRAIFRNGVPEENEETIKRTSSDDESLLEPRAGQGLDPGRDKGVIAAVLRAIPTSSYYVAFIVYQDSFTAFNEVKQQASDLGLDYGWDAFPNGRPLVFSKNGKEAAPPL
jgi:hypothetical protein